MKILQINKFFYLKGGAEVSFFETSKLLNKFGHQLSFFSMQHPDNFPTEYDKYFVSYSDYESRNPIKNVRSALNILYSFEAKAKLERLIRKEKPQLAHLNNIYHQISPSVLHTLKKFGLPVVITLRDYKMVCPSYLLLNKGRTCHLCQGAKYYHCFLEACVKNSRIKSLISTLEMYLHHRWLRVYNLVNVFISPSRFLINKLRAMGFSQKIVYLPNFVKISEFKPQFKWSENSIVYFGRLAKEKGLFTLLEAVKGLSVDLKIIGAGPLKEPLLSKVKKERINNVRFLGFMSGDKLKQEVSKSMFVVLPSEGYENNPRAIIEGFALGKPALASNIGGNPELIKEEQTGLTFEAANRDDLRSKIIQLLNDPQLIIKMGKQARRFAELKLNEENHYQRLIQIYTSVLNGKGDHAKRKR